MLDGVESLSCADQPGSSIKTGKPVFSEAVLCHVADERRQTQTERRTLLSERSSWSSQRLEVWNLWDKDGGEETRGRHLVSFLSLSSSNKLRQKGCVWKRTITWNMEDHLRAGGSTSTSLVLKSWISCCRNRWNNPPSRLILFKKIGFLGAIRHKQTFLFTSSFLWGGMMQLHWNGKTSWQTEVH